MKKSDPKGCYNLRQRIRAISGSTQKKSAADQQQITEEEIEYCSQCVENPEENTEPCPLCLEESTDNPNGTIAPINWAEIEKHTPQNTDRRASPSIFSEINASNRNTEHSTRPRAERTSLSSESSSSQTEESDSDSPINENTPLISTAKRPRKLFIDNQ